MFNYTLIATEYGTETLTVFLPEPLVLNQDHPCFDAVRDAIRDGEDAETIRNLADLEQGVASRLHPLSERVAVADGQVYFDGDRVDNSVTDTILRALDAGESDWMPLVRFMENLAANPNPHSRDQLYDWLRASGEFPITADGCFIGYKGVVRSADGEYTSVNSGTAIVDGQTIHGRIPNTPGSVIEMPRSDVQFDPSVGCSTGLHVGTFEYASQWARGALLKVKVNPRDCVSVPTDSDYAKLRVCRYTVLATIDQAETRVFV